ncbi:KEOPS complex subunit Cgi121 [Methanogenium marinum]|uniref:KEOPS complex subunit Cgi121 n=1 Tax=Methanogenium marinum TaxID=348610 RepID=A0A9Q4KTA1_9EURY|nr:KEOPS complex subunit Cgi121 [Methanogenium marinum]MDE4908402.1 KEOPS complex subunit Cgi121 [Methanogenium marinum]
MNNTTSPLMPTYALLYADAEIIDIQDFLVAVRAAADRLDAHIICMNADKIAGRLHIKTALSHACRTWFTDKNPIARSFEMEVLLWVAATRQTSVAAKFGAQKGTMPLWIVVVPAKESTTDEIDCLPSLSLYSTPPASTEDINAEKKGRLMEEFSIGEAELSTVGCERLPELVAERVALSAIYR